MDGCQARLVAEVLPGYASARNDATRADGASGLRKTGTLEWVDCFNHRRLLEPIGNIPRAEAEEQYYPAADIIDMAA